jgi:hypothetical protein
MEESINTNLSDYTLDELFALFDITITRDTDTARIGMLDEDWQLNYQFGLL